MGDDAYSWAIFVDNNPEPVVSGLTCAEVPSYKKDVAKLYAERDASPGRS